MSKAKTELAYAVIDEIILLRRLLNSSAEPLLSQFKMTRPQREMLYVLSRCENCSVGDLARSIGVSSGAITQMAEILVRRGLIARSQNPADRRITYLSLSESGKEQVQLIRQTHYQFAASLMDGATQDELAKLQDLLGALRQSVEAKAEAASISQKS